MHYEVSAPRDGIVVASSYGLKIYVERGHLVVHDGVGRDRRAMRFSRATSGLERLVVIGHAGYVTLEALRWIRDLHASVAQIDGDGELIAISSGRAPDHELLELPLRAKRQGRGRLEPATDCSLAWNQHWRASALAPWPKRRGLSRPGPSHLLSLGRSRPRRIRER